VDGTPEQLYPEIEERLRPLARPLAAPRVGDWLAEHWEPGQTFDQYLRARPVRRGDRFRAIYLCLVGAFGAPQQRLVELARECLSLFYDVPVEVREQLPLARIPPEARRVHPEWGVKQILTTYVLHDVLLPRRPSDALAYLALTTSDLWPGEGWNFVFGQANLRKRVGVWSLYRKGDPTRDEESFRTCLFRTVQTATHETGHILTLKHCTAWVCGMNGSNSLEESDRRPLHFCPVCLRKLCWNLQVEPAPYLARLGAFCDRQGFAGEANWYEQASALVRELASG
jgi:archaemetzincin